MTHQWRNVIALFVNEQTRQVAGRLLLDETVHPDSLELSPSRTRHVVSAIVNSGIAELTSDGALTLIPSVFPQLLAEGRRETQTGVQRFLVDGRIDVYPATPSERGALLRWVRDQVIATDEALSEPEMNERLSQFHDDVAVLRR
ncbi:DUF2087 domain-containing protein [Gulosibacter sp. ACHW.36C]|uniref:DUF2087 domain-containing protein n=1 Tax=Gulosibacter sediminis TaxID=1729695 RepID=A0ABY4MVU7_9MICO|nr:DUF2087 domain-containing protein [Gulosibacter sediminis]UQN14553.1 DUF2087 domain-containing protein [Gulosibacter sediminis]